MRRYGSLQRGAQRTAFREWWLAAGDDGIEATIRLSDDSITTLADDAAVAADGGLDLERRYAAAIARTDASYGALDDVIRSVERLDDGQQIAAKTLIARTSDDGVRLWRQLDDSTRATMPSRRSSTPVTANSRAVASSPTTSTLPMSGVGSAL